MNECNPNNREQYLLLYSDDFDYGAWEDVCDIVGVSYECNAIRINFDYSDVVVIDEEEDEDEDEEDDEDEYC